MKNVGHVIVLNGTSSSGKTTLAREIQSTSDDVYLYCALDAFWDMTPFHIPAGSKNFPTMKLAMAKSVKALAETGHNVVVDIVFCGQKTYQEFITVLEGIHMTLVKVECPLAELEARELARGDRAIGLAKRQLDPVHQDVLYDITVNTFENSTELCIELIMSAVLNK